jgi:hypothetical protein
MEAINSANADEGALETEDSPSPAEAETPAAPAIVEAPAPPTPIGPRIASFDDLTPDVDDLPPTRRKAPLRTLVDDRKIAIQQAIDAGNEKNAALARAAVAEKALEILTRRFGEPPAPPVVPPPPPETSIDAVKRRVDPATLPYDPEGVLAAAVDAAEERSLGHLTESERKLKAEYDAKLEELRGGLQQIQQERETQRTINAYRTAFPDRNPATDPDLDDISFFIEATNNAEAAKGLPLPLPVDDPRSYLAAAARLESIASRRMPAPAPPAPAPAPAAPVVAAVTPPPAPPVGSGAPVAAAPPASISALPRHDRDAYQGLVDLFPQLKKRSDVTDEILNELAADAATSRSPFSRKNVRRSV